MTTGHIEAFRVMPPEEFQEGNPYSAQVKMLDGETGTIRITPPCWFGQDYLDAEADNLSVSLDNQRTAGEATIVSFSVELNKDFGITARERVTQTTEYLLCALGEIANDKLFYGM